MIISLALILILYLEEANAQEITNTNLFHCLLSFHLSSAAHSTNERISAVRGFFDQDLPDGKNG
jgi:hypothetical protein